MLDRLPAAPPAECAELRSDRRLNLFVVAALYVSGDRVPAKVRIRNLSPVGALIEGHGLPETGAAVRLVRGSLSAAGEILWDGASRAGLRFAAPVEVTDWLPGGDRNQGQQRVDRLIAQARTGAHRAAAASPPCPSCPDYAAIARSLTEAGEALLADGDAAQRHLRVIQAIDIAAQALAGLVRDQ